VTWETLAAVAVGLALWLAAVWIWLWSASQWARIERHESKYGTVLYQPFAVLRSIPSFVGSIWILAGWAAFLDRVSPRILDRLPLPIGFVVLLWPMAVPAAIWLSGHPAVFVPPGARERQLGEAETRLNSSDQRRLDDLVEGGIATGALRLQGGRSYAIVVMGGGLLLTCAAVFFALFADARGWWAAAFFGIVTTVVGVSLIPGVVYLELTAHGFACHQIFKTWRYQWEDVAGFTPIRPGQPMVAFRFEPTYRGSRLPWRFLRPASGLDAGLPGTYGMRAEDLANLMNRWRERFAAGGAGRPR